MQKFQTHFICCSCCFKTKLVETRDCRFPCSSGCRLNFPLFMLLALVVRWDSSGWGGGCCYSPFCFRSRYLLFSMWYRNSLKKVLFLFLVVSEKNNQAVSSPGETERPPRRKQPAAVSKRISQTPAAALVPWKSCLTIPDLYL